MPANPLFTDFLCRSALRLDGAAALALGAQMWPTELRKGEFLFHQGDPCDHFHLVYEGAVDVQSTSPEGKELVFTTLRTGAPIGEATIVTGDRRSASIRARRDSTMLTIGRAQFLQLAEEHPTLSLSLARLAAETLRRLSTRIERYAFAELDVRLSELLRDLCATTAAADAGSTDRIDLAVTQQSLADQLAVSRESVNKHLGNLANEGLVELGRGRVSILDLAGLDALSGH